MPKSKSEINKTYRDKIKKEFPDKHKRHQEQQKQWRGNHATYMKQWYKEYKKTLSCEICGESHIACLDFNHKDEKNKKYHIARTYHVLSVEALLKEISKCQVLCSNCHRKLHYKGDV